MPFLPQAITFDAAGTLFHLAEPVGRTYSRFARRAGLMLEESALEAGFRGAWKAAPPMHSSRLPDSVSEAHPREVAWWKELVDTAFRFAGAERPISEELFLALFDHFGKGAAWRLYPETREVLEQLSDRFTLGVISNFDLRFHSIAKELELSGHFDSVILSGEIGAAKPSPLIFGEACRDLELPPEAILHVGDDPEADWAGAEAAGLRSFALERPRLSLRDLLAELS